MLVVCAHAEFLRCWTLPIIRPEKLRTERLFEQWRWWNWIAAVVWVKLCGLHTLQPVGPTSTLWRICHTRWSKFDKMCQHWSWKGKTCIVQPSNRVRLVVGCVSPFNSLKVCRWRNYSGKPIGFWRWSWRCFYSNDKRSEQQKRRMLSQTANHPSTFWATLRTNSF